MAASPCQQTHWLKLRVDLGLEQHSGVDPWLELDLITVSALPAVTRCCGRSMYLHAKQTSGGWGSEMTMYSGGFSCALENIIEQQQLLRRWDIWHF